MPTKEWFNENPRVAAYLSPELHQRLTEWMEEKNIRKTSQAITTILEEYFGVNINPVKPNSLLGLLEGRIEAVEERIALLKQELIKELMVDLIANPLPSNQQEATTIQPSERSLFDDGMSKFFEQAHDRHYAKKKS